MGAGEEAAVDPCSEHGFHMLSHQVRVPGSSRCEKQQRLGRIPSFGNKQKSDSGLVCPAVSGL